MANKIDLYREVLAIEPNSKVFFTLAGELAASGEPEEAVLVLKKGVTFHPDHVEAKFLLIELLTRLGRAQEAGEVFGDLGGMLAQYPSVWALWAEKADFAAADPALALSFLAGYFRDDSLTWATVLRRGLAAPGGPDAVSEAEARPAVADAPEKPRPAAPSAPVEIAAEAPEEAARAEAPDFEDGVAEEPGLRGAEEVRELTQVLDTVGELPGETLEGVLAHLPDAPDASDTPVVPEDDVSDRAVEALEPAAEEAEEAEAAAPKVKSVHVKDMGVRTLTMAALLAQQGDVKGALEIYRELLEDAGEEEKRIIVHRMDELGEGRAVDVLSETETEGRRRHRPNLVGMLEALAKRLENRAAK